MLLTCRIQEIKLCTGLPEAKISPFCDGSHTKHNEENGDNMGPQIIMKNETSMDSLDAANPLVTMLTDCLA